MNIEAAVHQLELGGNLSLLASQVVEGFINGMHKSPFHGFSSEFAEHKIYNQGESTRHIDWKRYAKTEKLYTKKYDEETNMRCHIILDNSSSMHYPPTEKQTLDSYNKIGFSALAAASLMYLLKRQRDAFGLSVFSDTYEFYAPEKGSERHYRLLLNALGNMLETPHQGRQTKSYTYLHQIAEKIHKRSFIVLFTDMFQTETKTEELFKALRHLKYNKHQVVLFHVVDKEKEVDFQFNNQALKFVDVETEHQIDLFPEQFQENYKKAVQAYHRELQLECSKYGIHYVLVDVAKNIQKILQAYLIERQKFI